MDTHLQEDLENEMVKNVTQEYYVVNSAVADLRREPIARLYRQGKDPLQETQLLFGEKILVKEELNLEEGGQWLFVEAVEQLCYQGGFWRGYPGWISKDVITSVNSFPIYNLFVTEPWTHIYTDPVNHAPHLQAVSLGTGLLGIEKRGQWWHVKLPDGCFGSIPAAHVHHPSEEVNPEQMLEVGKKLLNQPYNWGGRSAYRPDWNLPVTGLDCSGLTHLLYRIQGVCIPRDSHDQFLRCSPKNPQNLQLGDLIFSSPNADRIDHVMFYAGGEWLLEAALTPKCIRMVTFKERFGLSLHDLERGHVPEGVYLHFGHVEIFSRHYVSSLS